MTASFVSYCFTDYISLTALLFLCFHSSPSLKLNFWVPIFLSHSLTASFRSVWKKEALYFSIYYDSVENVLLGKIRKQSLNTLQILRIHLYLNKTFLLCVKVNTTYSGFQAAETYIFCPLFLSCTASPNAYPFFIFFVSIPSFNSLLHSVFFL
ncbi:hypothetical protein LEP1GSC165_0069 [Leptospira santarosai str. CBC523]|nr:hypothetical protein LEP1GSC165_0069 [Leptospira santarosai str. CBC523]